MTRSNRREAGRRRLAMRLPQMRTLIMQARDRLRRRRFNLKLVREYDETCVEIEQHVIGAMRAPPYANYCLVP